MYDLNAQFGAPGKIAFRDGIAGHPNVVLASKYGSCEISLYGANVISYRPVGTGPVLFLSKASRSEEGVPIRGGIPICWPWFGALPGHPELPRHGFARVSLWTVVETSYSGDETELVLGLKDSEATRKIWPYAFELKLVVKIGECLKLSLTTGNVNDKPIEFTQGFHPYFRIRDIEQVELAGVDGAKRKNFLKDTESVHEGMLSIDGEMDSLFYPPKNGCTIHDNGLRRKTTVAFHGTRTIVVWNPWIEKAKRTADLLDEEYHQFLCVEPVCSVATPVSLPPKKTTTFSMSIQTLID